MPHPALVRPARAPHARRLSLLPTLAALALMAAGCSSSGAGGPSPEAQPSQSGNAAPAATTRRDRNVLLPSDLEQGGYRSAYDALEKLHSNWLRPQGGKNVLNGPEPFVAVFLDDQKSDMGLAFLRQLGPLGFLEIRRLSPSDSQLRYGMAYAWGALVVKTR